MWDLRRQQQVPGWAGRAPRLLDVAFSPDGRTLATLAAKPGATSTGLIHLWSVADGRRLAEFPIPADTGSHVTFSADGRVVIATSAPVFVGAWLFGTADHRALGSFQAAHGLIWGLAVDPTGTTLATVHGNGGALRTWTITLTTR